MNVNDHGLLSRV